MNDKARNVKETLKITDQFRDRRGMVYDLKCEGIRLTVCVSPRENDMDLGDWRVEARATQGPEAEVVAEWGATRIEALRAVGRTWTSKPQANGLPTFDWEAVARVLTEVRAV